MTGPLPICGPPADEPAADEKGQALPSDESDDDGNAELPSDDDEDICQRALCSFNNTNRQ